MNEQDLRKEGSEARCAVPAATPASKVLQFKLPYAAQSPNNFTEWRSATHRLDVRYASALKAAAATASTAAAAAGAGAGAEAGAGAARAGRSTR